MKKLLAFVLFALLAALTTTVFGDNDGALSIVTPAQNLRLPQAEGGVSIFDVKNIQVQAKWSIEPTTPLSIDINNGELRFITGAEKPDVPVAFTVTVEDNFKLLNSQYENLAATAVITINFLSGVFVMGGNSRTGVPYYQDVWSLSNGGAEWNELDTPDWPARSRHQAVVLKGTIYVLGGYDVDGTVRVRMNDVWSSIDGKTWTPLGNAPWSARGYHQAVVHNGKIYVTGGGISSTEQVNDVWSSADGENWERKTGSAEWGPRERHQILSYKGLLYVLGGQRSIPPYRYLGVWKSADGGTWTMAGTMDWNETDDSQDGIYGHGAVVHKDAMYVLGGTSGRTNGRRDDVWRSTDGSAWQRATESAKLGTGTGRFGHVALSYNGLLYIMGGWETGPKGDIWSSGNGQNWTLVTNSAWSARTGMQAVIFP